MTYQDWSYLYSHDVLWLTDYKDIPAFLNSNPTAEVS